MAHPVATPNKRRGGYRSRPKITLSYILNKLGKFLQNGVDIGVGVQKILKKKFSENGIG